MQTEQNEHLEYIKTHWQHLTRWQQNKLVFRAWMLLQLTRLRRFWTNLEKPKTEKKSRLTDETLHDELTHTSPDDLNAVLTFVYFSLWKTSKLTFDVRRAGLDHVTTILAGAWLYLTLWVYRRLNSSD